MTRRILSLLALTLTLLLPLTAAAWSFSDLFSSSTIGFVPRTADAIGKQLDEQLMRVLTPAGYERSQVTIACTVPVQLGDLKRTSPLARQMAEEVTRYLVAQGYTVDEIRKGNEILMTPERGEFLLTRDTNKLADRNVTTALILAGTYTITDLGARFNIRLISTPDRQTLAMAGGTVPVTDELAPLLADNDAKPAPLQPTVRTRLRR